MQEEFSIRFATEQDVPLILELIKGIAAYEKMLDQVVATEEILHEWLFEKQKAEVLLGEVNGESVGFALFFHNFSTFLGRGGLYLEDIFAGADTERRFSAVWRPSPLSAAADVWSGYV